MDKDALIDEVAANLGASAVARKKWRQRGAVPHKWRIPIIEAAAERGYQISGADLAAFYAAREAA